MDERLRFVARLLEGEAMTDVCREFGISRKTGYKVFERYKEHGLEALSDRSRRPVRYANQLPPQIETLIITLKREKPHWGARKIRELLVRRLDVAACASRLARHRGRQRPVERRRTRQSTRHPFARGWSVVPAEAPGRLDGLRVVEQPARIAALVARWIGEGHARHAISNLKLPMKKRYDEVRRCEAIIRDGLATARVRHTLALRQLYHDRKEVTGCVLRSPG